MNTDKKKEYIAPEIKVVEVIVEKGFAITGIIVNDRILQDQMIEKHQVDDAAEW